MVCDSDSWTKKSIPIKTTGSEYMVCDSDSDSDSWTKKSMPKKATGSEYMVCDSDSDSDSWTKKAIPMKTAGNEYIVCDSDVLARSYQPGYRLLTVHTHGDSIVLSHWDTRPPAPCPEIRSHSIALS